MYFKNIKDVLIKYTIFQNTLKNKNWKWEMNHDNFEFRLLMYTNF